MPNPSFRVTTRFRYTLEGVIRTYVDNYAVLGRLLERIGGEEVEKEG
jgi:hypothetical protein